MSESAKIIRAIANELNDIDEKLRNMEHYFIFYTHTYEQDNKPNKNVLVIPADKKFDDAEFLGLIVDIIRDYANNKNIELRDSPLFAAFVSVLNNLRDGKDV